MGSALKKRTEVDTEPVMPKIDIYLQIVIRINKSIYEVSSGDGVQELVF